MICSRCLTRRSIPLTQPIRLFSHTALLSSTPPTSTPPLLAPPAPNRNLHRRSPTLLNPPLPSPPPKESPRTLPIPKNQPPYPHPVFPQGPYYKDSTSSKGETTPSL
ncbi:hypothetical protein H4I95_08850 [Botrytis cinerea]